MVKRPCRVCGEPEGDHDWEVLDGGGGFCELHAHEWMAKEFAKALIELGKTAERDEAIVRVLARIPEPRAHHAGFGIPNCILCGAEATQGTGTKNGPIEHDANCPWKQAREAYPEGSDTYV